MTNQGHPVSPIREGIWTQVSLFSTLTTTPYKLSTLVQWYNLKLKSLPHYEEIIFSSTNKVKNDTMELMSMKAKMNGYFLQIHTEHLKHGFLHQQQWQTKGSAIVYPM